MSCSPQRNFKAILVIVLVLVVFLFHFCLFDQKIFTLSLLGFSTIDSKSPTFPVYDVVNPQCQKYITLEPFTSSNSEDHQAFFLETSGKSYLTGRQACSVESAAKASGLSLKVIFKSRYVDLAKSKSFCDLYLNYQNVQFYTIDFGELFENTPVVGIEKKVEIVVAHGVCHYSDIARLALMYKYGGFYLDMDIIVINSLRSLSNVYAMEYSKPKYTPSGLCHRSGSRLQSSHQIFNGNLHLSKGHDLPWRILQHVNRTYDVTQNNRHMIGPEVSSSVIKNMYNFERFYNGFYPSPTGNSISNLTILPGTAFLPADFKEIGRLLWPRTANTALDWEHLFRCSYMVHFYSNRWGKLKVTGDASIEAYSYLGPKYCPYSFKHLLEF